MFCYNCGKQMVDGAKFCSFCGTKSMFCDETVRNLSDAKKQHNLEREVQENLKIDKKKDIENVPQVKQKPVDRNRIVTRAFKKYFNDMDDFIAEKAINLLKFYEDGGFDGFFNKLNNKFEILNDEIPLFAFDYKDFYSDGFLMTTKRITWRYRSLFSGTWKLNDIDDIEQKSYLQAPTIILLNNKTMSYSSDIILMHFKDPDKFRFRMQLFLYEINKKAQDPFGEVEAMLKYAVYSVNRLNCVMVRWKSVDSEYNADREEKDNEWAKEHYRHARVNYKVPEGINIYLLTSFESKCKKGYAICDDGLYYVNDDGYGYISWNDYKNKPLRKIDKHNITVGGISFYLKEDAQRQFEILANIRSVVTLKWDEAFSKVGI